MLIEFSVKNYRSFRDEAVLSMEATKSSTLKSALIPFGRMPILPSAAIYGKNGGGKSNVIRAFWLAVQFIRNAQRTQHEKAPIPVTPFALNDYSASEPTKFSFLYTLDGIRYWYSFSATKEKVYTESLYHAPKGRKTLVFTREGQEFSFTEAKTRRNLISQVVAENQLFFSVACTMNDVDCAKAIYKQAPAETMNTNYLMFHCMDTELAIEDLKEIHRQKAKKRSKSGRKAMPDRIQSD